jgi:hypothetical protein
MQFIAAVTFLALFVSSCSAFVGNHHGMAVPHVLSMSTSATSEYFSSFKSMPSKTVAPLGPSKDSYKEDGDLDTESLLSQSSFPIKPNDLIALAKETVFMKGVGTKDGGECLADGFVFRAAFVETPKEGFIKALKSFSLEDSFDLKQQYFGWTVDPLQPNRVWFLNRQEATHVNDFVGVKATGKHLILPPQNLHIDFNEQGLVKEFGFYTVDRAQGNTGGLGGAFAFFYGVGRPLPFPEGKPYTYSLRRRIVEGLAGVFSNLATKKEE